MTAASMSWRVPARPQGAASTPVRRTSTPQATLTLPKLSLETRRSWRSSLQTWIKPWRRCETWVWWRVWRRRTTPPSRRALCHLNAPVLLCPCHPPPARTPAAPRHGELEKGSTSHEGLTQPRCRWLGCTGDPAWLGRALPSAPL